MNNSFRGRDIISMRALSRGDILKILDTARAMEKLVKIRSMSKILSDKVVATLFLEPSTRTRLSFEAAALRLGARVITVSEPASSSVAKGETLTDTVRVIEGYADCIVMRQPVKGGAACAADACKIPIINAGDGAGEHPTQALLDLYTLHAELGHLDNVKITIAGDLKYGRTVHSLAYALFPFNPTFIFCAPDELQMPDEICGDLSAKGIKYTKTANLSDALATDVIYMTRIQRERFPDQSSYDRLKGSFVLSRAIIEKHNPDILVLHPLPRVDEILPDVDQLAGAAYFRQAHNGMFVRMALLKLVIKG
ncbi:MAG: aspartate carbamoyltransferase [Spirochaetaceae bacterium]|nr:MAG: aspartate carbamoyltransferase [Spirochaetaceae bacterium]